MMTLRTPAAAAAATRRRTEIVLDTTVTPLHSVHLPVKLLHIYSLYLAPFIYLFVDVLMSQRHICPTAAVASDYQNIQQNQPQQTQQIYIKYTYNTYMYIIKIYYILH